MTRSELDVVPGLGPARRAALLKHFGSVRKLRDAPVEEIAALPGFGPRTAAAVVASLNKAAPITAVPITAAQVRTAQVRTAPNEQADR